MLLKVLLKSFNVYHIYFSVGTVKYICGIPIEHALQSILKTFFLISKEQCAKRKYKLFCPDAIKALFNSFNYAECKNRCSAYVTTLYNVFNSLCRLRNRQWSRLVHHYPKKVRLSFKESEKVAYEKERLLLCQYLVFSNSDATNIFCRSKQNNLHFFL